jgi:hypothetical protein
MGIILHTDNTTHGTSWLKSAIPKAQNFGGKLFLPGEFFGLSGLQNTTKGGNEMKVYLLQVRVDNYLPKYDDPLVYKTLSVYRDKDHAIREKYKIAASDPFNFYDIQEMEMIYDLQPK